MRKLLFILLCFIMLYGSCFAQPKHQRIWQITGAFMIANHEIEESDEPYVYPTRFNNKDYTASRFFLFNGDQFISDPDYLIPSSDSLIIFRFGSVNISGRTFPLFSANGKWDIINMDKSLPDIMEQGAAACTYLRLDNTQEITLFKELNIISNKTTKQ